MYPAEGGRPLGAVATEVRVEALVGIHAQELSYDLDGQKTSESQSSGVGPRWGKGRENRASSQSSMRQKIATMKVL